MPMITQCITGSRAPMLESAWADRWSANISWDGPSCRVDIQAGWPGRSGNLRYLPGSVAEIEAIAVPQAPLRLLVLTVLVQRISTLPGRSVGRPALGGGGGGVLCWCSILLVDLTHCQGADHDLSSTFYGHRRTSPYWGSLQPCGTPHSLAI